MSVLLALTFMLGFQDSWSLVDMREDQQAGVEVQLHVDAAAEQDDLVLGDQLRFKVVVTTTSPNDVDVSIGHAKCSCSLSERPAAGLATMTTPYESIGGIFVEEGDKHLRLGVQVTPANGGGRAINLEYEYVGHDPFKSDVGTVFESDSSGEDRPMSLVVSVTRTDGLPTSSLTLDSLTGYSARKDLDLGDSVWTLTPRGDLVDIVQELVLPPTRVFNESGGVVAVVKSDDWKMGKRIFPKASEIGSRVDIKLVRPQGLETLKDCVLVGPSGLILRRVHPTVGRAGVPDPVALSLLWMGTESLAPGGYPIEFDLILIGTDSEGDLMAARQSFWFE